MSGGGKKNVYRGADRFTKQAKDQGFAARSVHKLDEIQRRFRVLGQSERVVDLGCFPGSWSHYAHQKIGGRGAIVGVDIEEPAPYPGTVIVRSVHEVDADEIRQALGGPADVVLSDMAPRTTGNVLGDHARQIELAQRAADLAVQLLKPGGNFVVKVFDGSDAHGFVLGLRRHFEKVKRSRPESVRRTSREFYVVCTGFTPA